MTSALRGIDLLAPFRHLHAWFGDADGRVHRRAHVVENRAHIEVRGAQDPARARMLADLKAALSRLDGVDWAEVDAVVGRAVVLFDPEALELDDLVSVVEDVEGDHDAGDETFPHDRPDHPADLDSVRRQAISLGADVAGLGAAVAGQALHITGIPAEIPGLVALVETRPRVRRFLENRLGPPAADTLLATTSVFAQAVGQGPLGILVDVAYRSSLVAEQLARRRAWSRREPELVLGPHSVGHAAVVLPDRPALPKGPVERYADAAGIASLGLVGTTLALTRDPRRSADLVFAGVPKAATLGREAFAAHLDVVLARKDVLVMDKAALRRFDRASTLVLDARLATSDHWSVDRIEAVHQDADAAVCAARTRSLLDPADPSGTHGGGSWVLAPWSRDDRAPRGSESLARRLRSGGRHALALWRGDQLMAMVAVAPDPVPLGPELVAAARDSGLEVVLAGGTDAVAERLGGVVRWAAKDVVAEIRAAQSDGEVVVFASGRSHRGLRSADVGIGVETPGRKAPLGADVVIRQGLAQGWLLLAAIRRARAVSRRSALLAAAGASAGAWWALVGPSGSSAQRMLLAVNASAMASVANGAVSGAGLRAVVPPAPPARHRWHELEPDDVLDLVGSTGAGLDGDEQAARRSAETERIHHEPVGLARAVADELANPLTPVLGLGAALAAAVGSLTDAGLVMGVVGANAVVGALQRMRTERALVDLEDSGASTVRVLVAGEAVEIPGDSVVVGDVVEVDAGDVVPGDCRILDATALEVDESTLTGESLPVRKSAAPAPGAAVSERTSMLYQGSVVAAGEASAVVVAVGRNTEAGRSAAAAAEPPPSGVEQRLSRLTRVTLPVTLGAGAVAAGLGFLYRRPVREAVGAGVSLTVAAVPEGLPALATLAQVASARRLASRNALVRNPRAIEALGRVDQVCFDKTGTLTEGAVSLVCVSDGEATEAVGSLTAGCRRVLTAAQRATPRPNGNGPLPHATDRAIVAAAAEAGADNGWVRTGELPFEPSRGYHAVLGGDERAASVVLKGAPEVVLPLCAAWRRGGKAAPLDAESRRVLEDHVESLGRRGLRVLAVATGAVAAGSTLEGEADVPPLDLVGFVGLADRVRATAAAAVETLGGAGVRVAMVTGDHPSTAEAIAAELGMLNGGRVLTGSDLDDLGDDELDAVIGDVAVFARVTPLQKVRIVASYQRRGRSVAMTGDGANDAAAIRLADAGIALGGRGTDAARSNADLVVVDDRIETIVDAVVEGRAMWESVRAAVAILVGGNLGEVGFTLAGTALGGSAPLNPRQLLLVNLLTDMAPALAIALREPPDRSPETLLRAGPDSSLGLALTRDIVVRAGATAAGATGAWAFARMTGTPARARTVGLAALVGTQLAQTLVAGGTSPSVIGATAVSVAALVTVVQTPGLSHFFGSRPLDPLGWSTAVAASLTATAASVVVPWAAERTGDAVIVAAGRTAGFASGLVRQAPAETG
ncbi:MAG: cation-translocating P-type ATPase [Acidimicrobiia bacterium]